MLDFRPSRHGLHFRNSFEPSTAARLVGMGNAPMGLCGGMSFVVRDLFERGLQPPPDTTVPARGTRRYLQLIRRQVQSFDWLRLPVRFWVLAVLHPDPPAPWSRALRRRPLADITRDLEWPRIRDEIDAGRLATLGLVRDRSPNPFHLTRNHQVLGYGYRVDPGRVTIRIYDPNWPDDDGVELTMDLSGPTPRFSQSTGEPLHGFFLAPFVPAGAGAWKAPG